MLQRTNIYLEPETIQYYKEKASAKGTSMAKELRMVINRKIENEKKDWKESMKSMIDNAGEGPEDLSQNHDEYLY